MRGKPSLIFFTRGWSTGLFPTYIGILWTIQVHSVVSSQPHPPLAASWYQKNSWSVVELDKKCGGLGGSIAPGIFDWERWTFESQSKRNIVVFEIDSKAEAGDIEIWSQLWQHPEADEKDNVASPICRAVYFCRMVSPQKRARAVLEQLGWREDRRARVDTVEIPE